MGDLVNKKNITEGALAISNSRVDGSQKIKDVDELKNRTRLYKEYSSKKGDAQVDAYITPRRTKAKINRLSAKQNRP